MAGVVIGVCVWQTDDAALTGHRAQRCKPFVMQRTQWKQWPKGHFDIFIYLCVVQEPTVRPSAGSQATIIAISLCVCLMPFFLSIFLSLIRVLVLVLALSKSNCAIGRTLSHLQQPNNNSNERTSWAHVLPGFRSTSGNWTQ